MSSYRYSILLILSFILLSCKSDDIVVASFDEEINVWLDTAGISATKDENTGIYYYPVTSNSAGSLATSGRVAAIYYRLFDLQDNVIASHQRQDGDSLLFKIGSDAVFPIGIDFGISLMREGEVFNFILPPDQGYQSLRSSLIPQNQITRIEIQLSALHDEVDLFALEELAIRQYVDDNLLDSLRLNPIDSTEFLNSGVAYKRRSNGIESIPSNGDTIVVDYQGRFINDQPFETTNGFSWVFGSNEPRGLLSGFEEGIARMLVNERALLLIPSSQGYQESALIIPESITSELIDESIVPEYVSSIPPYTTLLFEISRVD